MSWRELLDQTGFDINVVSQEQKLRPLWTVNFEESEDFLNWWDKTFAAMEPDQSDRMTRQLLYRDFYGGLQDISLAGTRTRRSQVDLLQSDATFASVNHLFDLTEQWVSRYGRYAPAIIVLPANSETNDRIAARMGKHTIDHLFYVNDIDAILESLARQSRIFGETYVFVEYDKNKGPVSPLAAEALSMGFRVPLLNQHGEQVLGYDGEPLFVQKDQRIGEVSYEVVEPYWVWVQPKKKWEDVEWIVKYKLVDQDEIIAMYPDASEDIERSAMGSLDRREMTMAPDGSNEILLGTLYHKSTPFLSGGRKIVFTKEAVLENIPLPSSHGELPVVRLTNVDLPGELHGQSFFDNLISLQIMINNLYSLAYKNVALCGHPYWLVPDTAQIARDKIRNAATVIRYQGMQKPEIATFNVIGQEIFALIEMLEQRMRSIAAIHSISQGEVPARLESGIALSKLEELEDQRANSDVKKYNSAVRKLARFSLSEAGDNYDASDGRTLRILGKNNQYAVRALDVAKLGGPFDVRVQRATALSESRSGRINDIYLMEQMRPGLFSNEQLFDLLNMPDEEKAQNILTSALQAAEFEQELIGDGEIIPDPSPAEESLVHWSSHFKWAQSASYKMDATPQVKEEFQRHMTLTEALLMEGAKANLALAQKLATLDYFPVFYRDPFGLNVTQILMMITSGQVVPKVEGLPQMMAAQAAQNAPGVPANQLPADEAAMGPPEEQMPMAEQSQLEEQSLEEQAPVMEM